MDTLRIERPYRQAARAARERGDMREAARQMRLMREAVAAVAEAEAKEKALARSQAENASLKKELEAAETSKGKVTLDAERIIGKLSRALAGDDR